MTHYFKSVAILVLFFLGAAPPSTPAQVGGIRIDAKGLLHRAKVTDTKELIPDAPRHIARRNASRKVSLKRLEAAISDHLNAGRSLPAEIRYLAGLQRIDEVLLLPAQGDVVLVGPAAGWSCLDSGEVADPDSGRPVLELDDLAIALRFAAATRRTDSFIGCSIDPTPDGLKHYAKYLRSITGPINNLRVPRLVTGMQRAMGHQPVRIFGVPANTRFACKLVAADYWLKRISMGLDRPPIPGLLNYIDLLAKANKSSVRRQHRFWIVATHQGISRSADSRAWRFSGPGLAVRTAAFDTGASPGKGKASPIAKRMATNLTEKLPQLAHHIPVFGELDNLVRLSIAAEIALHAPLAQAESRWRSRVLVDRNLYHTRSFNAPRQVPSLASIRKARGRNWIMSISGGVKFPPPRVRHGEFGTVDGRLKQRVRGAGPATTHASWWWN